MIAEFLKKNQLPLKNQLPIWREAEDFVNKVDSKLLTGELLRKTDPSLNLAAAKNGLQVEAEFRYQFTTDM